jgi:hypothetical protein
MRQSRGFSARSGCRVADAAPVCVSHLSTGRHNFICFRHFVFLFLLLDVFTYHLLVSPHCGDEVSSCSEVLTYEVSLFFTIHTSQVYRALAFDKLNHPGYRLLVGSRSTCARTLPTSTNAALKPASQNGWLAHVLGLSPLAWRGFPCISTGTPAFPLSLLRVPSQ